MKKKKILLFSAVFLLLYAGLLLLLTQFEAGAADGNITSVADAFWYSLVTMTTVGYGDFFPVTLGGRLVGFVFLMLSIGFLAFLVSTLTGIFLGRILPNSRLYLHRSGIWYIFDGFSEASKVLSAELLKEHPDGICIFCTEEEADLSDRRMIFTKNSVDNIARLHGESKEHVIFYQSDDEEQNYKEACNTPSEGKIIAKTHQHPDHLPLNVMLFDPYENVAREYWKKYPLVISKGQPLQAEIVLIGDGIYARNLLERALMTNVYGSDQKITYHLFGDWQHFLRNHYCWKEALLGDNAVFHIKEWNDDPDLLERAERIILCMDDDETNREILGELRHYFPTEAAIHVHLSRVQKGEITFGSLEEIYTSEAVLRAKLQRTARSLHEQYRSSAAYAVPAWEELTEFLRQSNLAAADHLLTKIRLLLPDKTIQDISPEICQEAWKIYTTADESDREEYRRVEHMRWERFHRLNNWSYAPVRNNAKRQHPLLLPFEELSEADQRKDDYAWELIRELSES